ncbi:MAG: DUF4339 domain-containing protein [Bacteroidetes bacterium]|nr:DUF4339 domain-containing protein [Bacteroidota bacterium]
MASYLLLRNNKESGPYTLEALVQLGLKPYDLVWVEGKSAAWRYPSEVEGLKFYAPAVEEQPFDRFYRKPSELKNENEEQKPALQGKSQEIITETQIQKVQDTAAKQENPEIEVTIPKKQVYVSMPASGGKTVVIIKKSEQVASTATNGNGSVNDSNSQKQEPFSKQDPVIAPYSPSYSELVSDYNKKQYEEKKVPAAKVVLPVEEDYPLEKKYSQSLDDMKDMYAQTLADRKRRNAQKKIIADLAKKVLPFAAVLIVGILVGVFIVNKKNGNDPVSQTTQQRITIQPEADNANKTNPSNNGQVQEQVLSQPRADASQQSLLAENKPGENKQADITSTAQKNNSNPGEQTNLTTTPVSSKKNGKKETKQNTTAGTGSDEPAQPKNIEPDPVTGERNKVVRQDNNNQPATKQLNNSLMKQVSVASNDYKRGTFGGIHDLQLTVTNNSNYLLDNVVVELQILKPNDQPLKTDNVRFSPVPPNGSLTLAIPATSRGVKVAYKVVHVESRSAVNDTAGLK